MRRVFDVHVHFFPPRVYAAIQRWFDKNAWTIRYRLTADEVVETLAAGGVEKMVGLLYSHVPGMARVLNDFMHELAARHPDRIIPFGTILPGEEDAKKEMKRALVELGFAGLKLHSHVQDMTPDDERVLPVFETIAEHDKWLLIHCGRAPHLPGYKSCSLDLLSVDQFYRAMKRTPNAKVIVPHMGFDEEAAYLDLLAEFPNLYLDTTMIVGSYFGNTVDFDALAKHSDRILYGSDFPNVPYEWTTELEIIEQRFDPKISAKIVYENAARLFLPG